MANVSSEQENIQTFYREQNELLFRYAMLLTGDRHQAEEALQTAWCQCLTYRETFFRVPEEKRPAWMRTVVRHAVYAQYQKTRHLVPLDPAWDGPAPEQGSVEEIYEIIRSMPVKYRVALELKFVLEWKEEKIAEKLGIVMPTRAGEHSSSSPSSRSECAMSSSEALANIVSFQM